MKFLMIVLAIRFVFAWLDMVIKNRKVNRAEEELKDTHAKHPAEFQLR
jgi:hypothetical protein